MTTPNIKPLPPLEVLQKLFAYEPETGLLLARAGHGKRKAGEPVGWANTNGYLRTMVEERKCSVHRICWALHHGRDPFPLQIDHRNRNRTDNRACNLRAVTGEENRANTATSRERPILVRFPNGEVRLLPSTKAAARFLDCARSSVYGFARGLRPHPAGLTVSYAEPPTPRTQY